MLVYRAVALPRTEQIVRFYRITLIFVCEGEGAGFQKSVIFTIMVEQHGQFSFVTVY